MVKYLREVANTQLCGFTKLLFRWTGSVYKLLWKEFLMYIVVYISLTVLYRCYPNPDFKTNFEKLCQQFQSYTNMVPINFALGIYFTIVFGRWWQQYVNIAWPDSLIVMIAANVHDAEHRGRLIRRSLVRYLVSAQVLTLRSISDVVLKEYPTIEDVEEKGYMTSAEYQHYREYKMDNEKHLVPFFWFSSLLSQAHQENRISNDTTYQAMLKEMDKFRSRCGMLISLHDINIPLAFTQVAEQLMNPFGEDDDDFSTITIIERNLEISLYTVDDWYSTYPKLREDSHWDASDPSAAENRRLEALNSPSDDRNINDIFANAQPGPNTTLPKLGISTREIGERNEEERAINNNNSSKTNDQGNNSDSVHGTKLKNSAEKTHDKETHDGQTENGRGTTRTEQKFAKEKPEKPLRKTLDESCEPKPCSDVNGGSHESLANRNEDHKKTEETSFSNVNTTTAATAVTNKDDTQKLAEKLGGGLTISSELSHKVGLNKKTIKWPRKTKGHSQSLSNFELSSDVNKYNRRSLPLKLESIKRKDGNVEQSDQTETTKLLSPGEQDIQFKRCEATCYDVNNWKI